MRIENVSLDRAHLWLSASQFWTTQKLIRICQIIEIFQILSIKSSIMSIRRGSRHLENIMSDFSIIYRLPTEASPSHTITTITNLFWQKKIQFDRNFKFLSDLQKNSSNWWPISCEIQPLIKSIYILAILAWIKPIPLCNTPHSVSFP